MGTPRAAVNGATTSVGFTVKLVTVQSVSADGRTAVCTDRQNTQVNVPMLIQRSKGLLPAPGETWLVTQELGQWTFSAIVAQSAAQFQALSGSQGVYVQATAPPDPVQGEIWINTSLDNIISFWSGTNWVATQLGATAIQPGSLTSAQLSAEAGIVASQVNFSIADIGGITTTFSAAAPANPSFGDLWYDAGHGYQLRQWSGTEWVPYQFGTQAIAARAVTTELLAAEAVTAAEIAAGTVFAGIIDGTVVNAALFVGSTFEGSNFVINQFGSFFYAGTPAAGNLIASVAQSAGNDASWTSGTGNSYLAGFATYTTPASGYYMGTAYANGGNNLYLKLTPAGTWIPTPEAGLSFGLVAPNLTQVIGVLFADQVGVNGTVVELNASNTLYLGSANAPATVPVVVAADIYGLAPGGNTRDTWNTMTLGNGWAAGSLAPKYRRVASPPNSVEVIGSLNGAGETSGTFFQLPSGYRPASTQIFPLAPTSLTSTGQYFGQCSTTGNLSVSGGVLTNNYNFHGFISLDA